MKNYKLEVHHIPTGKVWYGNNNDGTIFDIVESHANGNLEAIKFPTSCGTVVIPKNILDNCVFTYWEEENND